MEFTSINHGAHFDSNSFAEKAEVEGRQGSFILQISFVDEKTCSPLAAPVLVVPATLDVDPDDACKEKKSSSEARI